ncbi:MAG: chemotaxis protein CheX [Pirellula sp.]|jgi:chemotaxis protein CheX
MTATVQESLGISKDRWMIVGPFVQCTQDVFSMMLQWDVSLEGVAEKAGFQSKHDCSGFIGLSGGMKGSIVVSVGREVAFAAAEAFTGVRPTTIDSVVKDLVGELTNMIAGSSKDRLGFAGISLSLPTVVAGNEHSIWFHTGATVEILHFSSPYGPFSVEVGIRNDL